MRGGVVAAPRTVLSVDLDDLACYEAIYGLEVRPRADDPVLGVGLARLLDLLDAVGGAATFFCIGRTVEAARGAAAEALARLAAGRHEIGHHGHAHDYRLVDAPEAAFAEDLERGLTALERLGARPVGFRAPGYTHRAAMLRVLAGFGFRYDSSVMPSPPYFVARRAVQAFLRLAGRASASHPRIPWSDFVHTGPYRVRDDLWSLPISVSRRWRLPMVGTFLLAGPGPLRRHLERAAQGAGVLHVELHGLDAVDARDPGVPEALRRAAPELRVPVDVRLERLRRLLERRPSPPSPLRAWADALDSGRSSPKVV